jgi:small subunit ribosomal protein S16
MAIRLRLTRLGSKKRPFYRLVVAENTAPRDGKFIEIIGTYNPMLEKDNALRVTVKKERAEYWLSKGASPSDRVAHLFEKAGVVIPASMRPKSLENSKLNTPKKPKKDKGEAA